MESNLRKKLDQKTDTPMLEDAVCLNSYLHTNFESYQRLICKYHLDDMGITPAWRERK